ncbi:hypothetical protein [Pseudoxanthomonas winnipegensis]|uniref:Uncharacterized protein n=1 Tax=Pseudoxanthomonas winnipegensis TaxID=2480810 RepID=A0A4Q8LR42_9GAMM|nr:hypothetical protein [Pseudoxanthomonas winnipegensis]RZZ84786.1 hypothetical protein EA663_13420 [Pseudoxanthomonas winnipegensis]TAA33727.1 hypothetical protein EA656_14915 [Pseudoxanthomonas winnipegensis]
MSATILQFPARPKPRPVVAEAPVSDRTYSTRWSDAHDRALAALLLQAADPSSRYNERRAELYAAMASKETA